MNTVLNSLFYVSGYEFGSELFLGVFSNNISKGTHKCWDFGIYCSLCNLVSPRTDYHLEVDFGSDGELEIIQDDRSLAASMWNVRSNE